MAATGITGGFSPGRRLSPVRGTSGGMVGRTGVELAVVDGTELDDDPLRLVDGVAEVDRPGSGEEFVQPVTSASTASTQMTHRRRTAPTRVAPSIWRLSSEYRYGQPLRH
ncbi:MAG: hypothetical protein ACR2KJ_15265 [Jatrophihabitans sp.]